AEAQDARSRVWAHLGAQAVVALERADPVPGGGSLAEVRVVQPVLHLSAGGLGPLRLTAVLNFEGATIPKGELALGSWGKGFAPFGTDDPMVRPFLRYPVNHHLAQILERAVAIAAVRAGPLLAEAGLFNGDEPERPG